MATYTFYRKAEAMQYFEVEADTEDEAQERIDEDYNPDRFHIYTEEELIPVGEFVLTGN